MTSWGSIIFLFVLVWYRSAALLSEGGGDGLCLVIGRRDMVPSVLAPYVCFVCKKPLRNKISEYQHA